MHVSLHGVGLKARDQGLPAGAGSRSGLNDLH